MSTHVLCCLRLVKIKNTPVIGEINFELEGLRLSYSQLSGERLTLRAPVPYMCNMSPMCNLWPLLNVCTFVRIILGYFDFFVFTVTTGIFIILRIFF